MWYYKSIAHHCYSPHSLPGYIQHVSTNGGFPLKWLNWPSDNLRERHILVSSIGYTIALQDVITKQPLMDNDSCKLTALFTTEGLIVLICQIKKYEEEFDLVNDGSSFQEKPPMEPSPFVHSHTLALVS